MKPSKAIMFSNKGKHIRISIFKKQKYQSIKIMTKREQRRHGTDGHLSASPLGIMAGPEDRLVPTTRTCSLPTLTNSMDFAVSPGSSLKDDRTEPLRGSTQDISDEHISLLNSVLITSNSLLSL
jgi:hypothetical protein